MSFCIISILRNIFPHKLAHDLCGRHIFRPTDFYEFPAQFFFDPYLKCNVFLNHAKSVPNGCTFFQQKLSHWLYNNANYDIPDATQLLFRGANNILSLRICHMLLMPSLTPETAGYFMSSILILLCATKNSIIFHKVMEIQEYEFRKSKKIV